MEFLHLVVALVPICMLHNLGIVFLAIEAPLCSPSSLSSLCMFLGFFSPPPLLKHHQQSTLDLLHPSFFRRDHFLCIKKHSWTSIFFFLFYQLWYISLSSCVVCNFQEVAISIIGLKPIIRENLLLCFVGALQFVATMNWSKCSKFLFFLKVDVQKHEFHTHAST